MSEKAASPKSRFRIIVIIVILLLLAGFCLALLGAGRNKTVADRAYSWKTGSLILENLGSWTIKNWVDDNCTVYIKENSEFVPYLVLTSNYGGNALLLRKYLSPNHVPFNRNDSHEWGYSDFGAYYEDSTVDKYLNTNFISTLTQTTKNAIVDSNIIITDKSSWGGGIKAKTKTISRKVFLLSLKELSGPPLRTAAPEGKPLKYFKNDYRRMYAFTSHGGPGAYWTRTPELAETYCVFTIGNGGMGSIAADNYINVRPAFCLKKTTAITKRTDIVSGQTVYAIE